MAIKVKDPEVQAALNDIIRQTPNKKDVAPKQLRHFTDLRVDVRDQLDEGEFGDALDDTGTQFFIFKRNGKLFKVSATEVT